MNLLFVTPDFLPNQGGIANMTHQLATVLAESVSSVFVLAPGEKNKDDGTAIYTILRDIDARPSVMSGSEWEISEKARVINKIKDVIEHHDIDRIINMHPHYYGQALVELKAHSQTAHIPPFDSVFHGLELLSCFRLPKIKQSFFQKFIQRVPSHRDAIFQTVSASEFAFCNSRFTQRLVSKIDPEAKSIVIGCGVPRALLKRYDDISNEARAARRQNARRKLMLPLEDTIIGFVGRLVPHKNVDRILKLVAASPPTTHALVAGDGPELKNLESLARKLGVESRVYFRQIETDLEKFLVFESLDQFALLSKMTADGGVEGFGIVMLEAMATGIPVLSSGVGGTRDVLKDSVSGRFVNLKIPGQLNRVSRELIEQKDETNALIQNAQFHVRETFTWAHVRDRIIKAWSGDF